MSLWDGELLHPARNQAASAAQRRHAPPGGALVGLGARLRRRKVLVGIKCGDGEGGSATPRVGASLVGKPAR